MQSDKQSKHKARGLFPLVPALILGFCAVFLAPVTASSASGGSGGSGGGNVSRGDVLVRLKPGVAIGDITRDYHTSVLAQVSDAGTYSLQVPGGADAVTFAAKLTTDARVVYAEADTQVVSPEFRGHQIHFAFDTGPKAAGYINQWAYAQVNAGPAAAVSSGSGVIVAVLDTGVTFNHPDLNDHLLPGYNTLAPGTLPWDVADGVSNAGVGHGTMVAGIISRIAPGAAIMPVRVLNADGMGTMLNVAQGVHYAVTHGAKIINMSFGSPTLTSVMKDALDEAEAAGVVVVAAAGNDGTNTVQYPAAGRSALAVGSVEADNTKSSYSNYGSFVRVVAPGSGIRSTYWDGGYASWSGTSFSTPFVTAEAALLLSLAPNTLPVDVRSIIRASAHSVDALNPSYRNQLGNGIIDMGAAVVR